MADDNNINPVNRISKKDIKGLLKHLSSGRTLVGPVDTGKVIEFREMTAPDVLQDDRVSYKSIKEFYFPQAEMMFSFKNEETHESTKPPGYVIFGAKPCDLEALRVMSTVYTTGKYADTFFQKRFEANLLIAVGCINPKPECFCSVMGVDSEFSDFCDIMLSDDEDSYTLLYLSEKGQQALKSFPTTSKITCDNKRKANISSEKKLMLGIGKEDAAYFDIIDWEKATKACRGCGICTYICPTCYCFDFKDVTEKGEARRYKCWDSCMYPKFTLHASGHNPRNKRHERYRQRVLHKYKYVPENFDGCTACTGCGRCIRSCPVGINIRSIIKQVMGVES